MQWMQIKIFLCSCAVLVALIAWFFNEAKCNPLCIDDVDSGMVACRCHCPRGQFSLFGMNYCHILLDCAGVEQIDLIEYVNGGAVKQVYRGRWNGFDVAVSVLQTSQYREDFRHGVDMLALYQPSLLVTQLIGWCEATDTFVTEYHHFGSSDQLIHSLLTNRNLSKHDSLTRRFGLCANYVEILNLFHGGLDVAGIRVFCDSNSLEKLLSQLLVGRNLRLIANDLDALPQVTAEAGIKCGHGEIMDDFAAPEQLWPHSDVEFDDSKMVPYDEKIDIWKVPDVCLHFLSNRSDAKPLIFRLFRIHNRCKEFDAHLRPSATEILAEYSNVAAELGLAAVL